MTSRASSPCIAVALATLAAPAIAHADDGDDAKSDVDQIVLINASAKLGDAGQIERLHRVLDSRNMLYHLPEHLEATLDGRGVLIADLDQIKDAYMQLDYDAALQMIDADESRVMTSTDPVPALAELCQWRGLIAIAQEEPSDAVKYFRAAYHLNPAWTLEKKFASPSVRAIAKKAKHDATDTGALRIDTDPDEAEVSIDGGEWKAFTGKTKMELPEGMHLVRLQAKGRAPYAEMVDITAAKTEKLSITLDKETKSLRAARIVDETAAAPAGQARLKNVKQLARITGAKRYLVIEDGGDDHVTVRVYDVSAKKVSKEFDLSGTESSAAVARLVTAALQVDNMVDAGSIQLRAQKKSWYDHWYVWAGLGAVAIGAGVGYEYMTREPSSIRGFQ